MFTAGALPAASLTLARFRVSRWLVVRARLAVGVKVAVPGFAVGADRHQVAERAVGLGQVDGCEAGDALLKVKVTVAVSPAPLIVTVTSGRALKLPC
ncbi:hypothetical protein [Verminephrobacter eiseniae]|uniref:hypothetical protein n=1 Tax=Verminephrobacter eiseniae TaxID=364317 RepID=UPI0022378DEA|nr:hypothetical protein [Verminephrobacter eiseniae]